jgi:hypothetical protein
MIIFIPRFCLTLSFVVKELNFRIEPLHFIIAASCREQGCQIFLGALYQNGGKMYQMTPKLLYGHTMNQMGLKYTKWL